MSDGHADFFNCWWANVDWEVRGCCFDVGWVQLSWSIQEFFEVFNPPVSLFFDVGDYVPFLAFHWSFWFTMISREFLCCVIQLSYVSFSCSLSAVITKSSTYLRLSVLMLFFACLFTTVYSACALAFSALVRLVLIAAFLFLLS
ncbi:unnamed protein product [Schistosoma margrebowiei]|uniref:Transmembrane protein n=1 Tax=Schistosoma margrebowiei TaxID=48269 RepID=A0A3P8D641_9TREM|nr:unnamed protein product [Schistosoma margrebowiei]